MPTAAETVLASLDDTETCVTIAEIAGATGIEQRRVVRCVDTLRRRGYLDRIRRGCYRLSEAGKAAKRAAVKIRSGPQGPLTGRRMPGNTFRQRLWSALRSAGGFITIPELVAIAARGNEKNPTNNAQSFIAALHRAEYVVVQHRRDPGTAPTSPGFTRIFLTNNTGPSSPRLRRGRNELFDPNTGDAIPLGVGDDQ